MKLLNVNGLGDYAATYYEKIFKTEKERKELWNSVWKSENHRKHITLSYEEYGEEHKTEFIFEAYDFDDVDSEFIDFVRNEVQDYDYAKSENFYIID